MQPSIVRESDTKQLATFISTLNNEKQTHIGFCGTDVGEIQQTLQEDFSEDNGEGLSFVTARNGSGDIFAAIGLDIDGDTAEVWGPFQSYGAAHTIHALWTHICQFYPDIQHFHFFINEENKKQSAFAHHLGATYTGKHSILKMDRKNMATVPHKRSIPFEKAYAHSFQRLHEEAFPGTYYRAETILSRLNDDHTLKLLTTADHQLQGYAYYEIDPFNQEGSIEYIAINPQFRGMGLGTMLLREITDDMFSQTLIPEISLCVSHVAKAAIHIYLKAGFTEADRLNSYVLTRK